MTAPDSTPVAIAESEELGRGVFSRRDAQAAERGQVRPIGNPYHADIVLPESATDEWEQQQYALELASRARWLGRPE